MAFDLHYAGTGKRREKPLALPASPTDKLHDGSDYVADDGLRDAANVALLLGRPLLLSGKPGSGKTDFAASLAWELGYDPPLAFETKSTSTARDLFYTYDTLARFHAAQTKTGSRDARDYITYGALGHAIIRALPRDRVAALLPGDFDHPGEPVPSVVLIDEVDKAPRDFPNDILNELDRMFFRIPELQNQVVAAGAIRPVVVITSNSEQALPDAFLRRCVYYHLPFPTRKRLQTIVEQRLGDFGGRSSTFLEEALDLFYALRSPAAGLTRAPSTAELLDWLIALNRFRHPTDESLRSQPLLAENTLSALVKEEDKAGATSVLRDWALGSAPPPEP